MALKIFRKEGIMGLYKGNIITMLREAPGYGSYFASYEVCKSYFGSKFSNPDIACLMAGGIAGSLSWLFSYP